jgi:vacuolar-type H+-ATPase subunit I/STV1
MDERLGNISVAQLDVKELLATKAKGDMYPRVIPEAETISLLRLSEIKEAQVKTDELRAEKATQALDYYLDSSYQELEKKKKIYRAEKVLSQLQAQLQNGLPQE